jgi:hypothetical protein
MKGFVNDIIDSKQYMDLVKCMLMFIENDADITEEDKFYLFEVKTFVSKKDFCSLNNYYIDSFLLSVWYYLIGKHSEDTNKNAFTKYFKKNYALRTINTREREIKVFRYSENNTELADEYRKLKQNTDAVEKKSDKADKNSDIKHEEKILNVNIHKENTLNLNTIYLVQNGQFNSSADSDFDRLRDFRDDYNKVLEFINELDLNSAWFKDFIRFDFQAFELKVNTLAKKWDNGNRFTEIQNEELTDSIKQELKNYVDIIKISNGADPSALIPIKNRLAGYYRKLNYGVFTFDNLNNN